MKYEKLEKLLGKGGFSSVYLCKKKEADSEKLFAMKISQDQETNSSKNHLIVEYKILKLLYGAIGIPKVYSYGKDNNNNIFLIQELLGDNLTQELKKYKYKFPKKIYINIALQMISRIQFLHSYGLIHCDIKPDNFALKEKGRNDFIIYLIDYGLAEPFINLSNKTHKKINEKKGHKGTLDFCSINSHMGLSLSRRDDLESLVYCLIFLYNGNLPWNNNKSNENIMNLKMEFISLGKDIINKSLYKMLEYVTKLKFEEKPNYKYLKEIIKDM